MLSRMGEHTDPTAAETELTWNQRMHAIHRDELLSQGVWNALMVNTRAGDTANGFASLRDAADYFGQSLTNYTPPVCGHANL